MEIPIADKESFLISSGTTINVSEYGIRYSKTAATNGIAKSGKLGRQKIEIRTIHFTLPGYGKIISVIVFVVAEEKVNNHFETSCEFLHLLDEERFALRKYVEWKNAEEVGTASLAY